MSKKSRSISGSHSKKKKITKLKYENINYFPMIVSY